MTGCQKTRGVLARSGAPRPLRMLFFLDYDDGLGGRFVNSPGLLPLIGSTREAGFEVDLRVTEAEFLAALESPEVDVVGISSMERLLPRSIAVARQVRRRRPDVVLMIGGNSIDPFAVELAAQMFDLVALGEGEHLLPAVLSALARARGLAPGRHGPEGGLFVGGEVRAAGRVVGEDGTLDEVAVENLFRATFTRVVPELGELRIRVGNLYVRDARQGVVWVLEEPRPGHLEAALAGTWAGSPPLPAVDLCTGPLGEELDPLCIVPWDVLARERWTYFEFYAQRGCRWGQCTFCCVADRKIRANTPAKVVEVVLAAIDHGVEMFSFADDLFVQHPEWNREVLESLLRLQVEVRFRAQTLANRSVWPLLDLMRAVGFEELAFGLETLSPVRAEFMAKSRNGRKYVENAVETVCRTAAAGIYPVVYMIMVDPTSTLLSIAEELGEVVRFLDEVHAATGIVPKVSYSLIMLPVACTPMTAQFEHSFLTVPLTHGELRLPAEFKVSHEVAAYLSRIARQTENLPYRRENFASLSCYLTSIAEVADEFGERDRGAVRAHAEQGIARLGHLMDRLQSEVDDSVRAIFADLDGGRPGAAQERFDFRRLGGYIAGIERFQHLLQAELDAS